jgi:hypothetical protein
MCINAPRVSAVFCAALNVISLICAAKSVDQGLFIPCTTCSTLLTNMATGLLVWEDWRVIKEVLSYVMVHLIMLLGISLLASADVIQEYQNRERAETFTKAFSFAQEDGTGGAGKGAAGEGESIAATLSFTIRNKTVTPDHLTRARAPTLTSVFLGGSEPELRGAGVSADPHFTTVLRPHPARESAAIMAERGSAGTPKSTSL